MSKKNRQSALEIRNTALSTNGNGDSPRAAFLAANPEARKIHQAHIKAFHKAYEKFEDGLPSLLHGIVDKAEQLRQLGNVMTEFAQSLPGGKFTRDLYEQHKQEFTDSRGQSVSYELLVWSIKVADMYHDPIVDFNSAIKCRQPLLLATGEEEFRLEAATVDRGSVVTPPDALKQMRSLLDPAKLNDAWQKLKSDEHYFSGGALVAHQREILVEEWKPVFELVDEVRAALAT
jgi:hypothetical protein